MESILKGSDEDILKIELNHPQSVSRENMCGAHPARQFRRGGMRAIRFENAGNADAMTNRFRERWLSALRQNNLRRWLIASSRWRRQPRLIATWKRRATEARLFSLSTDTTLAQRRGT
jgi:hypothetical protein